MCGICGFNFEDKTLLDSMISFLEHRGPDEKGSYCDKGISLGHRRLSIIDVSSGQQPISNEDGSIVIVFNGEIYNYKDLKEELERKGHRFKTLSDTETLVHAYEEYGPDFVKKLNGCFALAIYNNKTKELYLARDRLGIKPLYYTYQNDKFMFASEIKSILLDSDIQRELNKDALSFFLSFRCNVATETMFKDIFKVPPGCYLIFKDNKAQLHKYWDLIFTPSNSNTTPQELLKELRKSIKYRLMSEVPLGAYISGGIDSATVTALMSDIKQEPLKTFSVGFEEESHNELSFAKIISDHFSTDHQEILVKEDTASLLPKIVWHNDEPMSDPTCIPTYLLSKETKKKCTVVLTGEGADEALAGYFQYKMMKLHQKYITKLPASMRKTVINPIIQLAPKNVLNKVFKYASDLGEEGMSRFSKYLNTNNPEKAYLSMVSIFDEDEKEIALQQKTLDDIKINTKELALSLFKYDNLNNYLNFETKTLLADNLLMKVDKMTMAHGIEARVPFLDHHVVEFCASLPPEQKLRNFTEKYILKKATRNIIPELTRKRKKERFFVPINKWFDTSLKDMAHNLLDKKTISRQGIFNPSYIEKAFEGLNHSSLFYSRQLWSLLNFQLWYKMFIETENFKKLKT